MTTQQHTSIKIRPESFDDLDHWSKKGVGVATIYPASLARYPSLGMHLLAALAEAERLGLDVKDGEIEIPLTDDEKAEKLAAAQRSWDYNAQRYERLLAGEEMVEWQRTAAQDWAREAGLARPEGGAR